MKAHARAGHLVLLLMFASFSSVFSELYEFISKYVVGYQFDPNGMGYLGGQS